MTTEENKGEEYAYRFTITGTIQVTDEHGEDIAYGWTKTILEDVSLPPDLPENIQKQVKEFKITRVRLDLKDE